MTDKDKWLLGIAVECVNWPDEAAFDFEAMVGFAELGEFYPEFIPYPENDFCPVSDEEYEAGTDKQRMAWGRQMDAASNVWYEKNKTLLVKVRADATELLRRIQNN
jgi:hypothetical protein